MHAQRIVLAAVLAVASWNAAHAQACKRAGSAVTCDDGRVGVFTGEAIVWPDGTSSRASPHPSVRIGTPGSVQVGPGVFVGRGAGMAPLDNPTSSNKGRCAVLDGVSYCH